MENNLDLMFISFINKISDKKVQTFGIILQLTGITG